MCSNASPGISVPETAETKSDADTQQTAMREWAAELRAAVRGEYVYSVSGHGEGLHPRCIPVGQDVAVRWADRTSGTSGQRRFRWYDAGSLAAELWTLGVGALDRHKHVASGLLGLVGSIPDIFWSMALHRCRTGLCVPPAQQAGQTWIGTTWAGLHMQKALSAAHGQGTASQRRALALPSPSVSASFSLAGLRTGFELPCFAAACPSPIVPDDVASLPRWWTNATLPWERAFETFSKAAFDGRVPAPCAFYLLPQLGEGAPRGCASDAASCVANHDAAWAATVERMRSSAAALLGTGGEVEDDAEELVGSGVGRPRGAGRPTPNGLASTAEWQMPDADDVAYLMPRYRIE